MKTSTTVYNILLSRLSLILLSKLTIHLNILNMLINTSITKYSSALKLDFLSFPPIFCYITQVTTDTRLI